VKHADEVLTLYDEVEHHHLADLLNHDPKTDVGCLSSHALWILGCPDRAVRVLHEAEAHARRRAHPFDLGWALSFGPEVFYHRGEPDELRRRAEECERLGRENAMPVLWALLAPVAYGQAMMREGKPAEALTCLRPALKIWDESGGKIRTPFGKSIVAEAMALTGDLDGALQLIDEQIEQVERPGWEERAHYAEILRLRGWMLSLKGDLGGAEKSYLASLDWARRQQAKSWELRSSISLARLWRSQGKREEAHDLLAPVYAWFTEGFDTRDLKEAKALLDELT
jgi:tetratricopeptide (TPR) repeat protein